MSANVWYDCTLASSFFNSWVSMALLPTNLQKYEWILLGHLNTRSHSCAFIPLIKFFSSHFHKQKSRKKRVHREASSKCREKKLMNLAFPSTDGWYILHKKIYKWSILSFEAFLSLMSQIIWTVHEYACGRISTYVCFVSISTVICAVE